MFSNGDWIYNVSVILTDLTMNTGPTFKSSKKRENHWLQLKIKCVISLSIICFIKLITDADNVTGFVLVYVTQMLHVGNIYSK